VVSDQDLLDDAFSVDEERGGDGADILVGAREFNGTAHGVGNLMFFDELSQGVFVLVADPEDDKLVAGGFAVEAAEVGDFLDAGRALGGPEIQHHSAALQLA